MGTTKRNNWERYTQPAIQRCFLEMLKKRPIEKISVGALCEEVDINRSTFYRHYPDLYALLDAIADDCYQELFRVPISSVDRSGSFEESGYNQILQMCELTEQKKDLYKLLLFGRTRTRLLEKIEDSLCQLYIQAHESSNYLPSPETRLNYYYLVHGITGVWMNWLRDDCVLPKEKVAQVIKHQISAFFFKMNELYSPPDYSAPQTDRLH